MGSESLRHRGGLHGDNGVQRRTTPAGITAPQAAMLSLQQTVGNQAIMRMPADVKAARPGWASRGPQTGMLGAITARVRPDWWHLLLADVDKYAALDTEAYQERLTRARDLKLSLSKHMAQHMDHQTLLIDMVGDFKREVDQATNGISGGLKGPRPGGVSADPAITRLIPGGQLKFGTQTYTDAALTTPGHVVGEQLVPCSVMHRGDPAEVLWSEYNPTTKLFDDHTGWLPNKQIITTLKSVQETDLTAPMFQHHSQAAAPLFHHKPSIEDVRQGGLGDCYLMAALISMVNTTPDAIEAMLRDNGDGTVSVKFHDVQTTPNKAFTPRVIDVHKSVAKRGGATGDNVYSKGAVWVSLVEKAYAAAGYSGQHATTAPTKITYGGIASGGSDVAWEHLTGKAATNTEFSSIAPAIARPAQDQLPWSAGEVVRYANAQPNRGKGQSDNSVYAGSGLASYLILGSSPLVDTWMAWLGSKDLEALAKTKAETGRPTGYHVTVRLEDFATVFKEQALDGAVASKILAWMATKQLYPGKRGSGKYTGEQLAIFNTIRTAIDGSQNVGVGTLETVGKTSSGVGQSGGEKKSKGLAGNHAYAVLDYGFGPKKDKTTPAAGQVHWVRLVNPWQHYGRQYTAQSGRLKAADGNGGSADTGQFWLELGDLARRFQRVYLGA